MMKEIQEQLNKVIKELFDIEVEAEVSVAPEGVKADFSSNVAMRITRQLHRNPMEIAEQIKEAFSSRQNEANSAEDVIKFSVSVISPGFLNFISSDEYFIDKMGDMRTNFNNSISCDEYNGKTVICEFSDPNPFKVLHVGHLYTSVVGDSISKLFEYAGAKVVRANFGGDVGLHVAKTLWALKDKVEEAEKEAFNFSIEDIAKCYVEGTKAYEENEEAKKEITELNKEIYQINKNDAHGTLVADLYWKGRELSYDYFKDFYTQIGLSFDKYYPESMVAGLGYTKVKEELEAGVYEMSDGAVVFRGEPYNLHTRVFINKEDVPTYEAKDVGLIFSKWNDYKFDKSVIITGNEQKDYMKVVLKSVEQYEPKLVERTTHLTHGLVKLPGNVKISSRLGNGLKAVDVLEMVADELKEQYQSEDSKVSLGATKYAFLKYKMGGNIVFDPKESVKMTGNSGAYLQYSAVRAKKVLNKIETVDFSFEELKSFSLNQRERELIKKVVQYRDVLIEIVKELAPHKLCSYLYELAQEFSRFYENCPVAGDEREKVRAEIVKTYLDVMEHGLDILGIEVPEEM